MVSKSQRELIKCRVREFLREPSAAVFVVTMPVLWMVLLGFSITGSTGANFRVGVVDSDTQLANAIQQLIENDERMTLVKGSEAALTDQFVRGSVALFVDVDQNQDLTYRFDQDRQFSVQVYEYLDRRLQLQFGRQDVISTAIKPLEQKGGRYVDFLIPGLIAFSIMTSSLFGTGMTLVVNRRENLLKRYLVTPMKKYEFILSHIVGRLFILVVEFAAIMAAAWAIFGFQPAAGIFPMFVLAIAGAATFTAIAIFCGSRTSNTATMLGITNLVTIPLMIVSGIWFSRELFPEWLEVITSLLPLAPLADGFRKLAMEGAGFQAITFELGVLGAYFVIATVAAKKAFRWY